MEQKYIPSLGSWIEEQKFDYIVWGSGNIFGDSLSNESGILLFLGFFWGLLGFVEAVVVLTGQLWDKDNESHLNNL